MLSLVLKVLQVVQLIWKNLKNLPRAIPLAIGIIALIYFGIVFVSMYIDPVAMVTSKEPVVLASVFKNQILQKS